MKTDLEVSTFQKRPAYRYIRESDKLPSCAEAANQPAPTVKVKLFDPTGGWTWFIAGYDPENRVAWGRVHGFEDEVGSIDMAELVALRGQFGLPIERDLYWEPRPISDCSPSSG